VELQFLHVTLRGAPAAVVDSAVVVQPAVAQVVAVVAIPVVEEVVAVLTGDPGAVEVLTSRHL
jgi:hypothetical protein